MKYLIITETKSFEVENVDEFHFDDDHIVMTDESDGILSIVNKSEYVTILRRD